MQIQVVKSKIHRVKVKGAAARKVSVGDTLILITYAFMNIEEAKIFKHHSCSQTKRPTC